MPSGALMMTSARAEGRAQRLRRSEPVAADHGRSGDAHQVHVLRRVAWAPEHVEHALSDQESASDVDSGRRHRQRCQGLRRREGVGAEGNPLHSVRCRLGRPACGTVVGTKPSDSSTRPPTAEIPEIALVTLIRGLCRAGCTPHTVWYPARVASPNLAIIAANTGDGPARPAETTEPRPAVAIREVRREDWNGSSGLAAEIATGFGGGGGGAGTGGAGWRFSPAGCGVVVRVTTIKTSA